MKVINPKEAIEKVIAEADSWQGYYSGGPEEYSKGLEISTARDALKELHTIDEFLAMYEVASKFKSLSKENQEIILLCIDGLRYRSEVNGGRKS